MQWKWVLAQRLEIWWWRQYLHQKEPKDYLAWKTRYWKEFVLQLPPAIWPASGEHVLEAGCGPAGLFMALHPFKITAFDPLLKEYQTQLPHFNAAAWPHVTFHSNTLEEWVSPQTYPLLLCCNAINHVQDWNESLHRLTACADEGGWLVLSTDIHKRTWTRDLFRHLPVDALHPQQHTRQDYLDMLTALGWTIVWEKVYKPGLLFDYWVLAAQKNPAG